MSDLDPAIRAVVIAEMSACVVDRDSLNWCWTHESRVQPRYPTCDAFDDATGLATSVREAIEPLIRADERERIAQAIEAAAIPVKDPHLAMLAHHAALELAAQIARNGGIDE